MMLGTIFCNFCDFSEQLMDRLERWTAPLYILFFVISGAKLDLNVLGDKLIVIAGLVYIIFRSLGKYFGAELSSSMVKAMPNVKKYLGITLLPQAGVALGMAMKSAELGVIGGVSLGDIITNITLFSVLIYELIGPFLTKVALTKAGEINPDGKVSARTKA
jgi:Kef-type K+ transport system membrane component KefB